MTREEIRARIEEIGIIPAVRLHSAEDALFAAEAICGSGIPIIEVTMSVPGAVEVIRELTRQNTGILVGAGTLFHVETARRCLDAGASFLTTPGLNLEIVNFALGRGVVVSPLLKAYRKTLEGFVGGLKQYASGRGMNYLLAPTNGGFDVLVLDYLRRRGLVE